MKLLTAEIKKPNDKILNSIRSKNDVDKLIEFINDTNKNYGWYMEQFPDSIYAIIHGNLEYVRFIEDVSPPVRYRK